MLLVQLWWRICAQLCCLMMSSCTSSHFHAHPSQAGAQPGIPFVTASSLHLALPPSSSLPLQFPSNSIWLLWSASGSGIGVNFPHTFQDTVGNIFYIFLVSAGCGGSSLVTVPFITKVFLFSSFFFPPVTCQEKLNAVIALASLQWAFTQLINIRVAPLKSVSTQVELWRFAQWCSKENEEPRWAWVWELVVL